MTASADPAVLERQNRELAILNRIATALNASTDLEASLQTVLCSVAELLDLRAGWVWLFDDAGGGPYLAATQNLPPALTEQPDTMAGPCLCLDMTCDGRMDRAKNINVVKCSRLRYLDEGTAGLRFHASIPLRVRDRRIGVMNVASEAWRKLSPDDLRLLHTIGDMLGVAVERARLFAASVETSIVGERNRLAREIHDTIAQRLSATTMQLETADALLEAGAEPAKVRSVVQCALESMRLSLEETRRSVLDLRAAALEGRSLAEALAELCGAAGCPGRPVVRCETAGAPRRLPSRVELALYRVAQEALTNTRKHARARHVTVRLETEDRRVRLLVEDDGVGFDAEAVPDGRFGMIGMRERMRLLGGRLRVESAPGAGTRIEAVVDLD